MPLHSRLTYRKIQRHRHRHRHRAVLKPPRLPVTHTNIVFAKSHPTANFNIRTIVWPHRGSVTELTPRAYHHHRCLSSLPPTFPSNSNAPCSSSTNTTFACAPEGMWLSADQRLASAVCSAALLSQHSRPDSSLS